MVKFKHSNVGLRKPSLITCWTLFLTLFVTFTFLILIILTLRIPKLNHLNSITHSNTLRNDDNKRWVQIISWEPRAFLYHNFLTKEECEHLINIAKPSMHKSEVIDEKTGKSLNSSIRTSSGTFLDREGDEIVSNIEKRIADFTFIPVEHGESFNVLHYEVGQKYEPHYDYFLDTFSTRHAGQRIATMLMYLSDVEEGGETVFPNAKGNFSSVPWWNELSDCGKGGLSIKPKMGNAILFWSMKPDATLDPSSLHGACPVIKGDKWSCAKWMHADEY
ncbi:putative procollagen-proline dioxygenase [Medicago truncatula]|uniref:procollagen-proline 4-dioxygenase n=1 Tax=Medicago truncatula TaxID=3880 RepID=G7LB40_MEDTR|nr:probable prolyl 4-hydroxylase 10 [Medicago truncatula]AET03713.1 prolyl 4-hydroxylase alpha-like protein [Medicago truncatula]AFK44766.1 unknown [Medicago truncatula]AFK46234.1 unknown [Medicago truncatula]RHN41926.1 putative procollagen-proline dioxygenase [Medicago truncatula]